jgi:hypothetical protein
LTISLVGSPEPIAQYQSYRADLLPSSATFVQIDGGVVLDTKNWQPLQPPEGFRFHPSLSRFAADGRFVIGTNAGGQPYGDAIIDTRADRMFSTGKQDFGFLAGTGLVTVGSIGYSWQQGIILIPTEALTDIPADLLQLWLQVAVRGELGPDGSFIAWDEPTWERHRKELAARPAPRADVPFPGYLATDTLHWLRQEFESKESDTDRLPLAEELLRRAEGLNDGTEATIWRNELAEIRNRLTPPKAEGQP